jgi:excisionase family DNA binding protein
MLPSDLITPKEAARLLRVHVSTVHRWIRDGRLHAYKRATERYLVRRADVEGMVREVVPLPEVTRLTDERRRAEEAVARLREKGVRA